MGQWLASEWHKIVIVFIALDSFWRRVVEWEEDFIKAKNLFGRRKGDKSMGNVLAELSLALQVAGELQTALPILGQAAADLKQAYADKSDPTKAAADVDAALTVIMPLITQFAALLPAPNVAPTTPTAAA